MSEKPDAPAWRRYLHFWGANVSLDIDDELRFHLEMRIQEYVERGMSPQDARRRAEARFGDRLRPRAECVAIHDDAERAHSRTELLDTLAHDLRFGMRLIRRQWTTAALAVACLALGIGATTSMFGVADALLIRALPFGNGDRLVTIGERVKTGGDANVASYPNYLDWKQRQHSFIELAALGQTSFAVELARPVRASSALVSANFFRTIGVPALHGRLFAAGEDDAGAVPVAIVSRGFAERELGGVERAVGRTIDVRGVSRTIVGVIADEQALPSGGELWLPVPRDLDAKRGNRNLGVIGWLRPGVTLDEAREEMSAIEAQLAREYPRDDQGLAVNVNAFRERFVGPARPALIAMMAATVLVLLVACANVAGIQLARATSRAREIAVRASIGASRARIARQLLTESVLLSLAGGVVGIAIAYNVSAFAGRSVLGLTPAWLQPSVDPIVLGFAVIVSVMTGILFGTAPALRLGRVDAANVLRGGSSSVGLGRSRLQRTLVVAQVALSVVLLVAAGLSIESVHRLQQIPLGFNPHGVLVFNVTLQGPPFDDAPLERPTFAQQVIDRAGKQTGVVAAGASSLPPLRCCSRWQLHIDGRADAPGEKLMVTGNSITPGYMGAMGIPVLRGRDFTIADDRVSAPVMLINETFAARYWPGANPIGRTVQDGRDHATIVGIVRDVKQGGVLDAPELQFYRPYAQKPTTFLAFAVRVAADQPAALAGAMRSIVREADPSLPVYDVSTMASRVDDAMLARRTFETLMLVFGAVALALACAGLFGVTSFFVAQRMRELGVRVALGAEPVRLVAFVVRGHAGIAIAGVLAGFLGSLVAARWLAHVLYGITPSEPRVFAIVAPVLALATMAAVYGPARRASAADPLEALRAD